jgi:hypothetical protein
MRNDLRSYTRQVIDVAWTLQRHGIVPNNATSPLKDCQEHLMSFEPASEWQKILATEAYAAYKELTRSGQARLNRCRLAFARSALSSRSA